MKKLIHKNTLISVCAVLLFLSTTAFKNDFFEIAKQIEIFTTMFKELNMNYVDETNPAELMDTAIKSMLDELDPYTQFYNEQDVEQSRINNSSDYTGIGAKVLTLKDKLVIVEAYKDYAADKAGLKAGDEIIKVDNVPIAGFKDDAANLLQGGAGSKVAITYKRQGKINTVTITRESLEIKAVPHYDMIDDKTGYIVLRKFTNTAYRETALALQSLKNNGATQLILDLRDNPGGLLSEAVNITNLFVPQNQLIVTTKSKVKKYNKSYYTRQEPMDTEIPLVILINSRSASASEIVSGALQDLDRAVIMGAKSFGKGLVQRPKPLTYGTQMKITISRYYTPSGRCIQALDYWNRDDDGNAIRIDKDDYNTFKTKNGRLVYDGGGIVPDIKIEHLGENAITNAILDENYIFNYATKFYYDNKVKNLENFKFTDKHFNDFKNYLKANNFNFETQTEEKLDEVLTTAEDEILSASIVKDINELKKKFRDYKFTALSKNKTQLKGLLTDEIIKRYFYSEGLYEYYMANNIEILKAIELLNTPVEYAKILR